ncbi:MAG: vitamin B12-dependent ribonucleotide reductase [Bacteroidia bacterium]
MEQPKGLPIPRYYTRAGQSPYELFTYERRTSVIRNPSGEVIFEMRDVEVPARWSQVATDILAQKYFRKAGVPQPDGSLGHETSVRQVVHRLAHTWRSWGEKYGYFDKENGQAFYDEVVYMLLAQIVAPNSPQWFNTGLYECYGIEGPGQGHWYVDPHTEQPQQSDSAYKRPQVHACFILSVKDDLVNEGGIMDLVVREARIFKYGSGVGTNFSALRAENEPLSGGGVSSGLMSFLKVLDRAAGAIKSGGTTRRAAKMVILDMDHPEILEFIRWKAEEEKKVAALVAAGYSSDYEGEAYRTVSGQNSNNSVRVTKEFLEAVEKDLDWACTARTTGKPMKMYKARFLWEEIAKAAWRSADPGLQYHTTINEWHTCPAGGPIRASNPCSEYMFLDDTACNLASFNLVRFYDPETGAFDVEGYKHAIRLWTIVLELSVLMAQFPSKEIALRSYEYRTLGLGYANLGALLMQMGVPYDSEAAYAITGALTAIMTGEGYATSAEMAGLLGPFKRYAENREAMLRVIRNHRYAAYHVDPSAYEGLTITPRGLDPRYTPEILLKAATEAWDRALALGEKYGYRNAQISAIAPTGTIGLLMDCDTTGIEPDFALVKFKKLSGGGYFKIINNSVPIALRRLGYAPEKVEAIVNYIKGHGTLENAPHINRISLREKGFTEDEIKQMEKLLPSAFDIRHVFSPYALGEATLKRVLGDRYAPDGDILQALGFSEAEIDAANDYICGTMTAEGAPYLKEEHLAVFDCANKVGKGQRFIAPMGHLRVMAAAQPFVSGAISKTVNLPHEATVEEIASIYWQGWKMGLKAVALYRDGSKLSQPLSSKTQKSQTAEPPAQLSLDQLVQAVEMVLAQAPESELKNRLRRLVNKRPLPARRQGITHKARINGQSIFIRTGEYEDGSLGELFIDMFKEGSSFRSLLNSFAVAISIGLQYGVPLEEFVEKFTFTRFEPSGPVDHPNVRIASSILDLVFRILAYEYLGRTDLVQVPSLPESANPHSQKVKIPGSEIVLDLPAPSNSLLRRESKSGEAPVQEFLSSLTGDAPTCSVCGHITVRSGTCYRCLNCGHSMGCS